MAKIGGGPKSAPPRQNRVPKRPGRIGLKLLGSFEDHTMCMSLNADHDLHFLVVKFFSEEEEMYEPKYL